MLHTVVIQFVDQKISYVYSEDSLLMQIIDISYVDTVYYGGCKFTHKGHLVFTWYCIHFEDWPVFILGRICIVNSVRWVDAYLYMYVCCMHVSSMFSSMRICYLTSIH